MAREIERRFLVRPDALPFLNEGRRMEQGYICAEPVVRFRLLENETLLTLKKRVDKDERIEVEFTRRDLPPEEIEDLRSLALWPPLVKVRYVLPAQDDLRWEVDVFEGANSGLAIAEIELPRADYPLELPKWIDPQEEVTHDPRYTNLNLTRRPYGTW